MQLDAERLEIGLREAGFIHMRAKLFEIEGNLRPLKILRLLSVVEHT